MPTKECAHTPLVGWITAPVLLLVVLPPVPLLLLVLLPEPLLLVGASST